VVYKVEVTVEDYSLKDDFYEDRECDIIVVKTILIFHKICIFHCCFIHISLVKRHFHVPIFGFSHFVVEGTSVACQ
jgi:hypothetical protein